MVDNSNMPHPKCLGSQKNPGTEPKTCEKGPKLGFEDMPTSKTSHCVHTACMAFPVIECIDLTSGGSNPSGRQMVTNGALDIPDTMLRPVQQR